jgi:exodeoxyribonuclease VII small subunit
VSAELTFEEARRELEQIVGKLESGQATLEEAVALWERGAPLPHVRGKARRGTGEDRELGKRVDEAKP